jgi:1,4-dihydroxy-2-naphthoate polyprenyltransferase
VIKKSTIQLLRFPFSIFLLPVFLFALSETENINTIDSLLVFIILHFLVFPSSNGYNSYMDRDTDSIGGLKSPLLPTKQLFWTTVILDTIAIGISLFISGLFTLLLIAYILASRAYSYRGIRLKKYPILGYLTVIIFQGAVTFFMVLHGCSSTKELIVSPILLAAASLLIGGFYPITQIYQHEQDKKDGVTTLSILLGYNGTFYFTIVVYSLAMGLLGFHYFSTLQQTNFFILQLFMLPIFIYFLWWFSKVRKNIKEANFKNTMLMNILASTLTNLAFITILIYKHFG